MSNCSVLYYNNLSNFTWDIICNSRCQFYEKEIALPIFYDCETIGLHGPIVLLQYAIDDGPIILQDIWKNTIGANLQTLKWLCDYGDGIVGFNLAFDWFHVCQMYTTLLLMDDKNKVLEDCIEEYALKEPLGRNGPCLKPIKACDLMLHARRGPYQSTMDRKPIKIKRIPVQLANKLAIKLDEAIQLKDIYFSRKKSKSSCRWRVVDIKNNDGSIDKDFKNLELKFAASSALKAIHKDIFGQGRLLFEDIMPSHFPKEKGWAPFALAIGKPGKWNGAWPSLISNHIDHWGNNNDARQYAEADVSDTRDLYRHFASPDLGDDDSELACCVAANRWKGFRVDINGLKKARDKALRVSQSAPKATRQAKHYLLECMNDIEKLGFGNSTKKQVLEDIIKNGLWIIDCPDCGGKGHIINEKPSETIEYGYCSQEPCNKCKGQGKVRHEVAKRAKRILDARRSEKEVDLYNKIIEAGRLHASLKVIGTKSTRMSGADNLNVQAIPRRSDVRKHFLLAWPDQQLTGGDFEAFEVSLAEAVYSQYAPEVTCDKCDGKGYYVENPYESLRFSHCYGCDKCNDKGKVKYSKLREDLLSGKSVHGLFGTFIFPGMTYEQIMASKGTIEDKYTPSKNSFFGVMYGGTEMAIMRQGISEEVAKEALIKFQQAYPEVSIARATITGNFCSMKQLVPYGKVEWHEPHEYIETPLTPGLKPFRRYFTLENAICKALYDLANNVPKEWKNIEIKCQRRERIQTASGATSSALFGAAFQILAMNMRAALNHVIQAWGAQICKRVQRKIWDLQPSGINEWFVQPINIHDEIQCPCNPNIAEQVKQVVLDTVKSFKPSVPLLGIGWKIGMHDWSEK